MPTQISDDDMPLSPLIGRSCLLSRIWLKPDACFLTPRTMYILAFYCVTPEVYIHIIPGRRAPRAPAPDD